MSNARIGQPVGQVLMTNVAIVRVKKMGKRFEVACYKNKVQNWRNGIETDINEVLQIVRVYENVTKGKFARKQDWVSAFGVKDDEECCKIILETGEVQISEGERKMAVENMYRDIATIIAQKCVNPASNRPYPFTVIERLMKEQHVAIVPNKSAKQQALEVIKKLEKIIPLARAKMKLQIICSTSTCAETIKNAIDQATNTEDIAYITSESTNVRIVMLIVPKLYRIVDSLVKEHGEGSASLEVLDLSHHQEGEHHIQKDMQKSGSNIPELNKKMENMDIQKQASTQSPPTPIQAAKPTERRKVCTTCGGFDFSNDTAAFRQHFRSEWHRYNLKLKANSKSDKPVRPVTLQEFEELDPKYIEEVFQTLSEA